jgi:predicted nucleic acid-binding protein
VTIIVDLSVALKWYVAEDGSDLALAVLDTADILAAPEYLHVEAANAMWAAVEKKRRFSAE